MVRHPPRPTPLPLHDALPTGTRPSHASPLGPAPPGRGPPVRRAPAESRGAASPGRYRSPVPGPAVQDSPRKRSPWFWLPAAVTAIFVSPFVVMGALYLTPEDPELGLWLGIAACGPVTWLVARRQLATRLEAAFLDR